MNNQFINRLNAYVTVLDTLAYENHRPIWENQPPLIFTRKVSEVQEMIAAIRAEQAAQEAGLKGVAQLKDIEETELETAAYVIGTAIAMYQRDTGNTDKAGEFDLTPSEWRALRDEQLLARTQLIIDHATELVALTDASPDPADYGVTPESLATLTQKRTDYSDVVTAPGTAIAIRKALTNSFAEAFRLADQKFAELDALILQFADAPTGPTLIAAYQNARNIKGPGQGSPTAAPTSDPAPSPTEPSPAPLLPA